jgi:mannosylglycoprotein endo-beta-mannosidase
MHGQALRKGDPLSPFLFVLAINPLTQILDGANWHGFLQKLRGRGEIMRTSLYASDATFFVAPFKEYIMNLAKILYSFGEVSRLRTNFQKRLWYPLNVATLT